MKTPQKGFIALISAIIISTVLLSLATAIGSSTFFARFDALNREYKRMSLGFAESCVTTALGKIGADFTYTASNVVVPLGTLYGKNIECTISQVSAGTAVNGKKTFTIATKASFNGAFSSINTQAIAQDPATAPVTPPPSCALNPTAITVPGGQSVAFAWSTSGASISSFSMDHGVGSLTPFSSGSFSFTAPSSPGVVTYLATVTNPGGSSTCSIVVTVTAPPPAPSCADTVMIFDRSGSMSSGDRTNERNAGTALTNLYAGVSSLPKIGAGSFGGLNGSYASIPSNGQLTSVYSTILSAINTLTGSNSSVGSNLGEAIGVGAAELNGPRHTSGKQKVLIFVSDGIPNQPSSSTSGNTGFLEPTANSANNSLTGDFWTNPANIYSVGSTTDSGAHRHRYSNFGFFIPTNGLITGLEVTTNARSSGTTATTLFSENFGTGSSLNDIPNWDEEGADSDSGTLALTPGSGNDSVSPDGGRFAKIGQDEWICRSANATGLSSLALSYYWRGDSDTENSDDLIVEYHPTSSDCSTGSGWNSITTQDLDTNTGAWVQRTNVALPASLNNDAAFLIRFRTNTSQSDENGRVDGITLSANPPVCNLGIDLSWNGGTSWTTERTQTLTTTPTTYTLGTPSDTWGRSWNVNDFSNANFRARIHATTAGSTCSVDTLTIRASYTIPTSPSQYAMDAAQSAKGNGINIFSIHYGDSAGQNFMGQLASNSSIPASTISTASRTSNVATITTTAAHHLTANERVAISGVSNSAFNGSYTVTSTPTPTTFTYALSGGTLNATGGTATPTNLFLSPASSAMTGIFQSIGYQICPAAAPTCSNTVDDDGDGLVDDADGGCHTDGNASNAATYDPSDNDEWTTPATPIAPPPPPPPPNITIGSWLEVP